MENSAWFEEWFDSPYYHVLYKERDNKEAEFFIDHLVDHLSIPKGSKILDLACGKGRHALQLHKKGFEVTGVDLSPESIKKASEHMKEGLRFDVHDMREVYENNAFEYIFNLFTSFGYFNTYEEDNKVVGSVHQMLKSNGIFVLDFLNMKKVLHELVPYEEKVVDGIRFKIYRDVEKGILVKRIRFEDRGQAYQFQEKIQVLFLSDIQELLENNGFTLKEVFGSYDLAPYDPSTSSRTVIIAQKNT